MHTHKENERCIGTTAPKATASNRTQVGRKDEWMDGMKL
jgi:hypothetical protein